MLLNDMSTLVDEVRQIEGKVVEISRLQEVFAEKVLEQVSLCWHEVYCIALLMA